MSKSAITNPAAPDAYVTARWNRKGIESYSKELATGYVDVVANPAITVVGRSLQSSATVQRAVGSSIQYATGLTDTALDALLSARSQIDYLKTIIAQANTATGATLANLDQQYRLGLQTLQQMLNNAAFNGSTMFTTVGGSTQNIRVGEAMTNTISVNLADLRANALNVRHTLDIVAVNNTDPLNLGGGNILTLTWDTFPGVPASNGGAAGVGAYQSTIAGVALPTSTVAPDPFTATLTAAGMTSPAVVQAQGLGVVVAFANYGAPAGPLNIAAAIAAGGYGQDQVVGSLLNTLQAVTNVAAAGPGTLFFGAGGAGPAAAAGAGGLLNANAANGGADITSTAVENQAVANSIVSAFGNYLDSAINQMVAQKKTVEVASFALDNSAKTAQKAADELLRTDVMASSAELTSYVQNMQASIFLQKQAFVVPAALLTLVQA